MAIAVLSGFYDVVTAHGPANCAGISRTSCPCSPKARPRKCDPTPASIPINDEGRLAVDSNSC